MTIKELKKILLQAPDENKNVFICGDKVPSDDQEVGWNYDDNGDFAIYEMSPYIIKFKEI